MEDWGAVRERLNRLAGSSRLTEQDSADIRSALERDSEMSRERDAFVAVLDLEGHNVVTAMVNAQALRQRVEELDREKAALLNSLSLMTESRDTAEAKLARCVEALNEIVANLPKDDELSELSRAAVVKK